MGELHSQNIFIILCCLRSVKGIFVLSGELGVVNSNAKDFSKKFSKCNM